MRTTFRLLTLAVLLGALAPGQPPFKVGLALDSPPTISGNCNPARVHFTGRLNATAPGESTYTWVRSDNSTAATHTLRFTKPGPLPVTYDWMLKGKGTHWVALKMLSPMQIQSRKVEFQLDCGK